MKIAQYFSAGLSDEEKMSPVGTTEECTCASSKKVKGSITKHERATTLNMKGVPSWSISEEITSQTAHSTSPGGAQLE